MITVVEKKPRMTAVGNCKVHDLILLDGHYYRVAWFNLDSWMCYLHVSIEYLRYEGYGAHEVAECNVLISMDVEVDRRQFRP